MRLSDYDTQTRYKATVVSSTRITDDSSKDEIREIVLDVDHGDFSYEVGQSVGVLAPGQSDLGQDHHFRLYSVADLPGRSENGGPRITLCVRRCSYIDWYSGEHYPGIASNYLCDLVPGDEITITGPYGLAFEVPDEPGANLILIGTGTGIAPFRTFVKHLYTHARDRIGRVWLFYGARSGLELLYLNDRANDFAQYYDDKSFEAFTALSARPEWSDSFTWDETIGERGEELWSMLGDINTYVYVAGLEKMRDELDKVFAKVAGSPDRWERRKAELIAGKRWVELLY